MFSPWPPSIFEVLCGITQVLSGTHGLKLAAKVLRSRPWAMTTRTWRPRRSSRNWSSCWA